MGDACAIGADGSGFGAFGSRLVNFGYYIKTTKRFLSVLAQFAGDKMGNLSTNAIAIFWNPGVDVFLQCSHLRPRLRCGEKLIS